MNIRATLASFLMLCSVQASAQSYSPDDLDAAFERDTIVIRASQHACYRFDVWIARSRPQLSRGLMFVRELGPDHGMLFIYGEPFRGRQPTYSRLDLWIERRVETGRSVATLRAGALNIFNRDNLFYYDLFTFNRVDQLPFVPSVGFKMELR